MKTKKWSFWLIIILILINTSGFVYLIYRVFTQNNEINTLKGSLETLKTEKKNRRKKAKNRAVPNQDSEDSDVEAQNKMVRRIKTTHKQINKKDTTQDSEETDIEAQQNQKNREAAVDLLGTAHEIYKEIGPKSDPDDMQSAAEDIAEKRVTGISQLQKTSTLTDTEKEQFTQQLDNFEI